MASKLCGRIFTLLHELAHIALNDGGICDLDDNLRRNASAQIEAYCNRVHFEEAASRV
jgi:Zn-dependent peptidase ImmA (M78 family)